MRSRSSSWLKRGGCVEWEEPKVDALVGALEAAAAAEEAAAAVAAAVGGVVDCWLLSLMRSSTNVTREHWAMGSSSSGYMLLCRVR
jgi:hypothetical protein